MQTDVSSAENSIHLNEVVSQGLTAQSPGSAQNCVANKRVVLAKPANSYWIFMAPRLDPWDISWEAKLLKILVGLGDDITLG